MDINYLRTAAQWRNSMHVVLKELTHSPPPNSGCSWTWHNRSDLSYQPIKKSNHSISHAGIRKRQSASIIANSVSIFSLILPAFQQ
ncbi:40S ribosomal protein S20 [Fusarium oxysporum f. sp. albedinis]|nr:40S ribosomal protein S20 [Fusarium oxysporum f. sp. albedinis]